MMLAFFAGVAAGILHVFSGPDHLAAVAPLATAGNRRAWTTGLQWGAGHTVGVVLIGAVLLLVSEQLPLDLISAYSERIVGVALIGVGTWGLWKARRPTPPHTHGAASFAMGTLHGLAGSSHLFGVLPALAFSGFDAMLYLAGFGIGAIASMSAFAAGIGLISIRWGHARGILYASSAAALVIGGVWLVA